MSASPAEIPATQRAWRAVSKGKPRNALKLFTDLPVPITKLKPGDVLVKVQAGALNPVFYKTLGMLPNWIAGRPTTAEMDFAGVVVDSNGSQWSVGDEVFGWIPFELNWKTKEGALCEYTVVPADNIALRPPNLTPTQAAGICLAGMTGYQAIFKNVKMEAGQTLFINGGSTAVGTFATIFAKARGIKVVVTASTKNEKFVRAMGADEYIDYTKQDLVTYLSENPPATKYDVILEAVGIADPSLYVHSEKYLAPGGVYLSVDPMPRSWGDAPKLLKLFSSMRPGFLGGVKRKYSLVGVQHKKEDLDAMREIFANGEIKPPVDSVHAFEDALNAYDRIMSRRGTGKIVVKVDPTVE